MLVIKDIHHLNHNRTLLNSSLGRFQQKFIIHAKAFGVMLEETFLQR